MAKHRLYEESISTSIYATDRGHFRAGEQVQRQLGGRLVGYVNRPIQVGDFWSSSDDDGLAGWERELVESVAAARRERGL